MLMRVVQSTYEKYAGESDLLPEREAQSPDRFHRQHYYRHVQENVRYRRSESTCILVDAFAIGKRPYPCRLKGQALEDVGEHYSDAPCSD